MKRPLIGLCISVVCLLVSGTLCSSVHSQSDSLLGAGLFFLAIGIVGGGACIVWLVVALLRGKS